jgi:hypothetical protein
MVRTSPEASPFSLVTTFKLFRNGSIAATLYISIKFRANIYSKMTVFFFWSRNIVGVADLAHTTLLQLATEDESGQSRPERRKGKRQDSQNVSALSAGAYITTLLVRVTLSPPCCCVQARVLSSHT